jgi:hypothetical protein
MEYNYKALKLVTDNWLVIFFLTKAHFIFISSFFFLLCFFDLHPQWFVPQSLILGGYLLLNISFLVVDELDLIFLVKFH